MLNYFNLTLNELLQISGSTSKHAQNLQALVIEIYESINHDNPDFIWD